MGTHNARKDSPITQEDFGHYFLRKGLARIRELLGQVEKAPVSVTESGQNFTEIKLFEEFLVKEVDSKDSCCATRMYHRLHYSLFSFEGKNQLDIYFTQKRSQSTGHSFDLTRRCPVVQNFD